VIRAEWRYHVSGEPIEGAYEEYNDRDPRLRAFQALEGNLGASDDPMLLVRLGWWLISADVVFGPRPEWPSDVPRPSDPVSAMEHLYSVPGILVRLFVP